MGEYEMRVEESKQVAGQSKGRTEKCRCMKREKEAIFYLANFCYKCGRDLRKNRGSVK